MKNSSASTLNATVTVEREEIDLDTGNHSMVLNFATAIGSKYVHVPRDELLDERGLRRSLIRKGISVDSLPEKLGVGLLADAEHPRAMVTTRGGWYDDTLVTRYGVLTPLDSTTLYRFGESEVLEPARQAGSLRDFLTLIGPYLLQSTELLFSYMLGLVPPLADRLGRTGGFVVCYSAESSTGKTTCARLAQSLSTSALEVELANFGDSTGSLLDRIAAYSGQITCFGDIKAGTEKGASLADKIQTVAFSAVNGRPRKRKGETALPRAGFNLYFFSAEDTIESIFAEARKTLQDGDRARLLNIALPSRDEGGILSNTPAAERDDAILALDRIMGDHHGRVMRRWARKLRDLRLQRATDLEGKAAMRLRCTDALHNRVAKHFALVHLTGIAAVHAGVLPVTVKAVQDCIDEMFGRVVGEAVRVRELSATRYASLFQAFTDESFYEKAVRGHKASRDAKNGFWRTEDVRGVTRDVLYLPSTEFDRLANTDVTSSATVLERLKQLKVLVVGRKGNTVPIKQSGIEGKPRYVCIDRTALAKAAASFKAT